MHVDELLREIASAHYGLVDVAVAIDRGIARTSIDRRVAEGALLRVRRSIYRLPGAESTDRQRLGAALLAAGPGAVLIGKSAAYLHGLQSTLGFEIGVPPNRAPIVQGVRVRRVLLPDTEVTKVKMLATTTVARTLLDLAATALYADVEQVVDTALSRDLSLIDDLRSLLSDLKKHPWKMLWKD